MHTLIKIATFLRFFSKKKIRMFTLLLFVFSIFSTFPNVFGQEWCATSPESLAQGFTNGSCFRYFTSESLSREAAKTRCATAVPGVTGDLAQIPSQFAQTTLYRNLLNKMSPTPRNLWIGARGYTSPEWRWSDGRPLMPLVFANWAPGQPQPEPPANTKYCAYVELSDPGLQWRVDNCGIQKQFVCEYKLAQNRPNGYQFVAASYKLDWYSAKVECQREGGQLMDMTTADQLKMWRNVTIQMITQAGGVANLPGRGAVWLGLNRQIWLWDPSDKEVAWSNFSAMSLVMEPVQECVYLTVDLEWIATSCSAQLNYLCQFVQSTLITTTTTASTTTPQTTTLTNNNTTLIVPAGSTTLISTLSPSPAPVISESTTAPPHGPSPQQISGSQGTEPYIIAIIIICVICLIIIIIAILLACCAHLWLPSVRRIISPSEAYTVASPSPTKSVDVAITAHPCYATQGTGTNGSCHGNAGDANIDVANNQITLITMIPSAKAGDDEADYDDNDTVSLPQCDSRVSAVDGGAGPCFSSDEPPNDIPELYTSPTYLYSYPSHRPLEPVAPNHIDDTSSFGSSNLSRSPSTTAASPTPPLLPPKAPPKQLSLKLGQINSFTSPKNNKTTVTLTIQPQQTPSQPHTPQTPPTPPPPFRASMITNGSSNSLPRSNNHRRFDDIVNV